MFQKFLILALLLGSSASFSATEKTISFQGQTGEVFDLENWLKETRYREEQVPDTCYRQIPYTENVCRDVTRYRQECRTVPGHQDCRIVYDPVCRYETRYRQECRTEPGRQICRNVTRYRQECTNTGGGQTCRTEPGRRQCRNTPSGEVCRDIPPRQICDNKPPQRICRQVPYQDRECTTEPGQRTCRQVPYQEQVCQNVPRNQCDWIPDQRVCENIPYNERVCQDETRYRQEPYACTRTVQVPYVVTVKTHKANVTVDFDPKAAGIEANFMFELTTQGDLSVKATEVPPTRSIIFLKKTIENQDSNDVNSIDAKYDLIMFERSQIMKALDGGIQDIYLESEALEFVLPGNVDLSRSSMDLRIRKKDETKFEKSLTSSQYKGSFDGQKTTIKINLRALGAPKLGGFFNKKHEVKIVFKLDYSDMGSLLVPNTANLSTQIDREVKVQD